MTKQEFFDELDYWLFIGIGDDILVRPEYGELVKEARSQRVKDEDIPAFVLGLLKGRVESSRRFRYMWFALWGVSSVALCLAILLVALHPLP